MIFLVFAFYDKSYKYIFLIIKKLFYFKFFKHKIYSTHIDTYFNLNLLNTKNICKSIFLILKKSNSIPCLSILYLTYIYIVFV